MNLSHIFKTRPHLSKEEIKRYLAGNLTREQIYDVENHMVDCPLCSDAVDGFDRLRKESNETAYKTVTKIVEPKRIWMSNLNRIAATILLLLIPVSIVYYFTEQQASFYDEYYVLYENNISDVVRGAEAGTSKDLIVAMAIYDEKDYKKAYPLFQEIIASNPMQTDAMFYAAQAAMQLNETTVAIDYLNTVALHDPNRHDAAIWYLALCHVQQKNMNRARPLLKELIEEATPFQQEATKLLRDIAKE